MKKLITAFLLLVHAILTSAQDMKGMDMSKKEHKQQAQPVTYTCPMHHQIHSPKPGNCPICGMKLIRENPKQVKPHNDDEMQMGKNTAKKENTDIGNMHMPKDTVKKKKSAEMGDMKMNDMSDMNVAKANLGSIKTIVNNTPPRTVRYDLYIADTIVKYGKKLKRAIAVNGQIPMPTLTFTEGDTAEIWVYNDLDEPTALHWHGLFLPNRMDGVPYLTQMPIKPHTSYLYKYPIRQHGTHWYHSHSKLEEQIGMYGAFIMNKRKEWDIPTIPVVLSEWTDVKPEEVHRRLRSAADWFAIQKGAAQSYAEAIKTGNFKVKVTNEWKRMNAMDVTDIFFDNFLINGKNQNEYPQFKAGDKIRMRIINSGASDYFWLSYSGGKMTVVASDGNDVEPVEVDRLIIAVSETYDVVITIPENKSYEFLATPEDRTGSASLWLGSGEKVPAAKLPRLKYFAGMKMMNAMMDMRGNMIEMEGMMMRNQEMDMNTVMYPEIMAEEGAMKSNDTMHSMKMDSEIKMEEKKMNDMAGMNMGDKKKTMDMSTMTVNNSSGIVTLNYSMLRSPEKTTLPKGSWKELKFDLTGNMNRFVWSLDNKVVSESDKILIKRGENIRIILFNNSMMRHPMHLHGHDFRLRSDQGENAIMKNIIDIMPMERDTIEFHASENGGDWFFHCHILYHMMSGMGRVFSYDGGTEKPDIKSVALAKRKLNADDKKFHRMGILSIESNGSDGDFMLAQTRWQVSTLWRLGFHPEHGYESETSIGRYLGRMQWWYVFAGFDYHYKKLNTKGEEVLIGLMGHNIFGNEHYNMLGQVSNKNNRSTATVGIQYTLPMLVIAEFRADLNGKFRFQLSREGIPVTSRFRLNFMVNTDKEYAAGVRYILTKYLSVSSHYDSDMGLGAGISIVY